MSPDAFVVVDEVAAAVEDEPSVVDLDWAGVVGRVAVHDVHAMLDKVVRESHLLRGDLVAPI
jgi:hypothetical protein